MPPRASSFGRAMAALGRKGDGNGPRALMAALTEVSEEDVPPWKGADRDGCGG